MALTGVSVQQGSWWETTIPAELKAGQYIVRNEVRQ